MTPEQTIEMLSSLASIVKMLDRLSWAAIMFIIVFMMCSFLHAMTTKP
jgi:uncharacterized protein involved in exopolysaccharide biosynthesis